MYMKNANTIITDNINDIPLHELAIGTHIIKLNSDYNDELNIDVNTVTNMLFSRIIVENLYLFSCIENTPNINIKEIPISGSNDIVYQYEAESASYNTKECDIGHIIAENLCIPCTSNNNKLEYELFYINDDITTVTFFQYIHNIYKNNFLNEVKYGSYSEGNEFCNYLLIPISEKTSMVLSFMNKVKKHTWNVTETILLINDKELIDLSLDIKIQDLIKYFKNIKNSYDRQELNKFKDIIEIINFDIYDYLNTKPLERNVIINKLTQLLLMSQSNIYTAKEYFTPIYENKKLGFNAYLDTVRRYSYSIICTLKKDNKITIISGYELEKFKSNILIHNEIRKAQAIYGWIISDYGTISPYNGKLYYKGKETEGFIYTKIIHSTHKCIWALLSSRNVFFILLDGYYVLAEDNEYENNLIQETKEDKLIIDKLSGLK